jgi:hypothetical protein
MKTKEPQVETLAALFIQEATKEGTGSAGASPFAVKIQLQNLYIR